MILGPDGNKMSSSKGNVVMPNPIVDRFGADAARTYILFLGPADQDAAWSDEGVGGVHRFLARLYRLGDDLSGPEGPAEQPPAEGRDEALVRKANWAIDKVTADLAERFAFNTAFPFAPHLGAEVYELLTGRRVWVQPWPAADPAMLQAATFELVLQVNGKVRDRVRAPTGASREELERLALEARGVRAHVDGRKVAKVVVVPDKLVNVVVR
jgi:leucyl-tRNA synthetase